MSASAEVEADQHRVVVRRPEGAGGRRTAGPHRRSEPLVRRNRADRLEVVDGGHLIGVDAPDRGAGGEPGPGPVDQGVAEVALGGVEGAPVRDCAGRGVGVEQVDVAVGLERPHGVLSGVGVQVTDDRGGHPPGARAPPGPLGLEVADGHVQPLTVGHSSRTGPTPAGSGSGRSEGRP